ncbi:MAG: endo-1,4-beta-xylanase [Hyphomicrobium sp.]
MSRPGGYPMSRRSLLKAAGLALAGSGIPPHAAWSAGADEPGLSALAAAKGLMFGASFASHELDRDYASQYAAIYERDCAVLTTELELKLPILRPDAGTIDFAPADRFFSFAEKSKKKVRGHTLIWNDYLPEWISRLDAGEVERLLETHIETVIGRYRDRVCSWDVVNEPVAPWDRLPGKLRKGAFYSAMGENYIARSFAIARIAAPKAQLVLNEAQTESDDENGQTFRIALLALLKRLKDSGAPIDAVGLQCHLDSARPYDFPRFAAFVEEIAALGYEIAITELDVNDHAFPDDIEERDAKVAGMYRRFLAAVLPIKAVRTLTLWQMADHTSWVYYQNAAKTPEAARHPRPLIYDANFNRKPAWFALAQAFETMAAR